MVDGEVVIIFDENGGVPEITKNGEELKAIVSACVYWKTGDGIESKGKTITTVEYFEEETRTFKKMSIEKQSCD